MAQNNSDTSPAARRFRIALNREFSYDTLMALDAYYPDFPRGARTRVSTGYANYPGSYGGFGGMSESTSRRAVPFDEEDGDPELPTYEREDRVASSRMSQSLEGLRTSETVAVGR